jgi:hypothetical protein
MRQMLRGSIFTLRAAERCRQSSTARLRDNCGGAAATLDHVLNDEGLWHGSKYPGEVFLRHLIEAARDYIIRDGKAATIAPEA